MKIDKQDRLGIRTWIEIDRAKIANNYQIFRKLVSKKCKLMAVVKSNAYGHHLVLYSKCLEGLGIDWFAVDSMTEALTLRASGIEKPILVLGYTLPEMFKEAAKHDISLSISDFEQLDIFKNSRLPRKLKVHIKVDTGLHRQGFCLEKLSAITKWATENPHIMIEGLYTHLAAAKDPKVRQHTTKQLDQFREAIKIVESFGLHPIYHVAATPAAMDYPESHFDMVRIGTGLMGIWPGKKIKDLHKHEFDLQEILSWKTIVSETKSIPKGENIGYDFTEKLINDSKIAVIPIGYWHGLRRSLSSVGEVLVHGKRARIIGRISMDMAVIDVTNIPDIKIGDVVTVIGEDGKDEITIEEITSKADIYDVEFVTLLNPQMRRIYY